MERQLARAAAVAALLIVALAPAARAECPEDLSGNGQVDFADVLAVIAAWGPCGDPCPEDLSGNGQVDFADVLAVIAGWGPCPPDPEGSCCLDSGSCTFGTEADCNTAGGAYQGDGIDCVTAACPQPGACCLPDESCAFNLETACGGAGGEFQGSGVTCEEVVCATPTGFIDTIAGTGNSNFGGDGGPAIDAFLDTPDGMDIDAAGNIFFADSNNHRIRRIDAVTGVITTVAGNGDNTYAGDGGPAVDASLRNPSDVVVDAFGNLFIADTENNRIRRVDAPSGIITTVAGRGIAGYSGDGGQAFDAELRKPQGLFFDGTNLYIADTDNARVRVVNGFTGIITTVAGNGSSGYSGDGMPATLAALRKPEDVCRDASGNLYIADRDNHRIRRVDPGGIITTYAGTGSSGYDGDGGPANLARLAKPNSVYISAAGELLFTEKDNDVVRRVDLGTGTIDTVAGNGSAGFAGDGGPATAAKLKDPGGVAVDPAGDVILTDLGNHRIREVDLAVD